MAAIRKQMPSMPDLNLNFTQDEEEEEEKKDEENLLSIMIKLKKAKDDNESTRKRFGLRISYHPFCVEMHLILMI